MTKTLASNKAASMSSSASPHGNQMAAAANGGNIAYYGNVAVPSSPTTHHHHQPHHVLHGHGAVAPHTPSHQPLSPGTVVSPGGGHHHRHHSGSFALKDRRTIITVDNHDDMVDHHNNTNGNNGHGSTYHHNHHHEQQQHMHNMDHEESDVPTSLTHGAPHHHHSHSAPINHMHHASHTNNGNHHNNGGGHHSHHGSHGNHTGGMVGAATAAAAAGNKGASLRATASPYHSPTPSSSSLSLPSSSSSSPTRSPDASPLLRGRRPAPMTISDSDNAYTPSPSSRSLEAHGGTTNGDWHGNTHSNGNGHHGSHTSNGHQHPHSHTHASLAHRSNGQANPSAHRRSASTSFSSPQPSSLFAYSPFGDTPLSGLSSALAVGGTTAAPIGTIPSSTGPTPAPANGSGNGNGHMRSLSQGGTPAVSASSYTSTSHAQVQHFDFKPRAVQSLSSRSSLSPLSSSFAHGASHSGTSHGNTHQSPSHAAYGTIGQVTSQSSSSIGHAPSPPQGLSITIPSAIGTPSPSHRTVRVVPSPSSDGINRERMERMERVATNGDTNDSGTPRVTISVTIPSSASPSPTLSALQTSLMPPPLPVFFPTMHGSHPSASGSHGMPSTITEEPSSPMNSNGGDRSPSAASFANGSASPQRECIQYARNGVCPRGAGCTFKHSSRKSRPCKYFLRGRCVDDAKCEFSHSKHWLSAFAAASSPTASSTSGGVAAQSLFSPFECALCGKHFTGVKQKQQHEEGREHKHNMTVHYLNSLLGKVPFTGDNCFNCGQLGHKFSDCSFGFCRFFANRECRNGAQCALPHIGY